MNSSGAIVNSSLAGGAQHVIKIRGCSVFYAVVLNPQNPMSDFPRCAVNAPFVNVPSNYFLHRKRAYAHLNTVKVP